MVNLSTASDTAAAEELEPGDESPKEFISVPLYISGCLGTLAAVIAVTVNLGFDLFGVAAVLLGLIGYFVSFAYRKAGLPPRLLNTVMAAAAVLLVAFIVFGRISIGFLEPATLNQGDLQLAVTLEWLMVLYVWTLTDDRKVVTAAILAISTIGLVAASDVNPELIACFVVYVLATVFLLIHQNYLLHWNWGRIDIRQGVRRLVLVQVALALVSCLFVVLAGMVLVVPLQKIGSHLSLASAFKGLVFASGTAADAPQSTTTLAVSDTRNFPIGQGGDDSDFSLSKQIIFIVYPDDKSPHYWRGNTYDSYSSQGWNSTLSLPHYTLMATRLNGFRPYASYPVPEAYGDSPAGPADGNTTTLHTRFDMVAGNTDNLYLPARPFAIMLPAPFDPPLTFSKDGHVELPGVANALEYSVASVSDDIPVTQLRKLPATPDFPSKLRRLYISQLDTSASASDQQRLADTARRIVAGLPPNQQDEYDRASAIRGWVSDHVKYSLDVPPTPNGEDAVAYFLFTSRTGYCDLYASSMAILCRYAGIPARIATGFAPGEGRRDGGFNLRAIDKHAWCEVYFPRYGWVEFDPTSGTQSAPKQTLWTKLLSSLRNAWSSVGRLYHSGGPIPLILTIAILGGVGYILATEGYSRLRSRSRLQQEARRARAESERQGRDASAARANAERRWQSARGELRRWNLRQKPSETAREYALRAGNAAFSLSRMAQEQPAPEQSKKTAPPDARVSGADPDTFARALNQLAASYTQARYAANDAMLQSLMDADESGEGDRELEEVRSFVAWSRPLAGALANDTGSGAATQGI